MMTSSGYPVKHVGYLIQKRDFKNHSIIATMLVNQGQLVKGLIYNAHKQGLMLFRPFFFECYHKQGLSLIHKLEPQGGLIELSDKPLFCGLYANELLGRLGAELQANDAVYSAYQRLLVQLKAEIQTAEQFEQSLRHFENVFLQALGYELDFCFDSNNEPIAADSSYQFCPSMGFIKYLGDQCQAVYNGHDILSLVANDLSMASLKIAKQINRQRINHLLDGQPLVSRSLFSGVEQ